MRPSQPDKVAFYFVEAWFTSFLLLLTHEIIPLEEALNPRTILNLIASATVIAGGAVLVGLLVYNPASLGPGGVTFWFIGLFVVMQGAITLGLFRLKRRQGELMGQHKRLMSSWRQGALLAGIVTIMLGLSSLRQLGQRDVILLVVLGLLIEFYGRTRK